MTDKPKKPKQATIRIETSDKALCEITHSDMEIAKRHYEEIKVQGIFMGRWITKIELN